ncbi:MAG: Fe-S cluster assembly protein SufB, partial [Gammaproteobacteria bacterium]
MNIKNLINKPYSAGFVTDLDTEQAPPGLNEEIIRLISSKKQEPEFLLEFRLKAFRHWLTMQEPTWANVNYPPINYQDIIYFAAPKNFNKPKSIEEIDPKISRQFHRATYPFRNITKRTIG